MDTKQPLSIFLVAMLVASVFTVVGISGLSLQRASAQTVTIETSADGLGGTFFGEGMVQVIIEDANADDDNADTIDVTVELSSSDGSTTETITVPDTSAGSQRFEFFIVHVDSTADPPADPITTAALTDDQILEFGDGATADELDVTGLELYEDASFEIRYGNVEVTIDYEEDPAVLETDRDVFGSTSLVYFLINDQDANLDPTTRDSFTANQGNITALIELTGGAFVDDVTFEETGDNTAVFEATVQLTTADSGTDPELDFTNEVINIQLNDMANYNDPEFDNAENDSTDTSETSIEIDDSDGEVDALGDLTFGTEIRATVRDEDQNRDSDDEDSIDNALTVVVDSAGGDTEQVDLEETGDNTGVFQIDLSNGELRITFLSDAGAPVANNGILELRAEDIEEDLIISYVDPLDDDSTNSTVAQFRVALDLTPGRLMAPAEVGITDEFTATLTDADLNDNPRTRDSYTWSLTGESPFDLTRGGAVFSEIYQLEIEVDGNPVDFDAQDVSVTMRETGINTGVFEFEIDVDDLNDFGNNGGSLDIDDGDRIELNILDFMADVGDPDEHSVRITIGRPSTGLDFSRTVVPLPPEDGSGVFDLVGDTLVVTMVLVDPILNNQTNVEQDYLFTIGDGPNQFLIEVEDADGLNDCALADGDTLADCDLGGGVDLADVLTIGNLEETGRNTGVFEVELEFSLDGVNLESGDFQNAEFRFTYFNNLLDDESAGFTMRGNDGIVTVDQPSATSGTIITITIEDQDLNLDDNEIDEFESTLAATDPFVVAVESEDDDIGGGDTQTFEETGEDTGVFTAEFEVGEDILIVDVAAGDQATNILVTYNDEVDSAGGGGDELEVNIPVVSSTGSIQVTPELVGPASTLTVLIVDSDLDDDANSIDEWDENELDDAIEFSSSRREVRSASPDIEETGPNTGVFMFELELITGAEDCADDDLSANRYRASGGDTDSTIGACPGDLIAIRYVDERTANGGRATVSEVIEVRSWDPEFAADKESYSVGDRVTVSISDPDANRDPDISDSLTDIRVTSDSDRVGETFSAIETGRDTGVFRLSFGTTSGTAGGSISVSQGDDITIEYTDEFPADFVDEEEDKEFQFVISVGGGPSGTGATQVTPPRAQTPTGQPIDEISAGQQVVLTTSVRNNNANSQPFVAIVEVRDSSGITVFLAWQTGTLTPNGQTNVGLSWTPDFPGDYTFRTFVISDLATPSVLSPVSTTEVTVS